MLAVLIALVWFVLAIHDFLAISDPVQANVLVVESWVRESAAMQEVADEFNRGKYDVVLTASLLPGAQGSGPMQENNATHAAEQLRKLGVDAHVIKVLTVPNLDRHRTYTSALAVKHWLVNSQVHAIGINVYTIGAHARKSQVLFRRAFDRSIPIGVIAGTETGYSPERWWLSMRGIYTVLRKTVGYLYAKWWPLPDDLRSSAG